MSEINKLDNTACPFNPEQYKIDTLAAPVSTSPWALIQVYLGNKVHRKDWDAPDEYIHLILGNSNDDAPEIKKRDKHGVMTSWQPTQEDLMACDWSLLKSEPKPDNCMLSFDLEIGTSKYYNNGNQQDWGYLTHGGDIGTGESTFGSLTNLQSTIGIGSVLVFILMEQPIGNFDWIKLQVDTQNQSDLPSKNLEITVDGSTYYIDSYKNSSATDLLYDTGDAQKLGDLLKQNVGNKLHFCFNWK
ncbi:DUF2829 domain-containing protein [Xenorhabdus sp. DI]|uniref:Thoeris anti-defense Tad2 family protein n=1 Tax=Xenorhabdus doucetiae TaxID=351671 RepID=UPI0019CD7AAA|nr:MULTISPECIES: MW1434 family type I TA system toxin [unclassified Xenorhabdus]MBD2786301.1 DUF2829 domain-containing protein [Xenorhabdus sp. 3]MBD2789828.1 DUF2829 domain-containing protein [Xenorhabdus sp. DI]